MVDAIRNILLSSPTAFFFRKTAWIPEEKERKKYQLEERTLQTDENSQGSLILKNFRIFSYVKPFALAADVGCVLCELRTYV